MKKRNRGKRFGMAAAAAALTTMVFGVSSSNAADAEFTFDDAALNVGVAFDILEPPATATMTGTIADGAGAQPINVPAANFVFPPFAGSGTGIPVEVEFSALDPLAGTADIATGEITFDPSTFHAQVKVQGTAAVCNYDFELALTTADEAGNPYGGDPFTMGGDPVTAIDGALQDGWAAGHLPADTGGTCPAVLDNLATGAGGIALGNGVDLTPLPPPVNPPADPTTKKKCKKGQKLKKGKCVCKKGFKKGKKGKCVKKKKKKKKKK
jgi:hypothetical protein